jgi:two-component system, cell cycle sensor histidine kinase and response regulator CckA
MNTFIPEHAEAVQSQKLEILGRLAGGVAHDMNNALTVINGFSELALMRLCPSDPCRGLVEEVRKAGEHAADLTRQLLTFSRKQAVLQQSLNLNRVIAEMEKMLRRVITEDIELVTHLQHDLYSVMADLGQMEQLLMNLAVNGRDAMPEGGKLSITTSNIEQDAWPHSQVMLAISDSGTGMSEKVKAHLFEPFFTTKEAGTGLGLATVHSIVRQADGRIEVESEPGHGSTFRVYLPGLKSPSWSGRASPAGLHNSGRGAETILLVEDDDGVRNFCRKVLRTQGYRVLEAQSADEATQRCEQNAEPIHLLVSDVVMPGRSGHHLAEQLLELRPEMRVLYVSGYTDDEVVQRGVVHAHVNFLQKPFSPHALSEKVREVLDTV